eukprot:evm.model.scf_3.14 EVM.evm.TU.scf_3.14   scf_3:248658-254865(+)
MQTGACSHRILCGLVGESGAGSLDGWSVAKCLAVSEDEGEKYTAKTNSESDDPEQSNGGEVPEAEEPASAPEPEEAKAPSYKSRPMVPSAEDAQMWNEESSYGTSDDHPSVFVSTAEGGNWASLEKEQIKLELLEKVASLDRGFAVTPRRDASVREVVEKLETLCGSVSLSPYAGPGSEVSDQMDLLGGVWRLLYSSGFNRGNLGGTRPGPLIGQLAVTPFTVGQIFQRVDVMAADLDNIVDFNYNGLRLPWLSSIDTPAVRLTLKHKFEVQGVSTLKVSFMSSMVEILNSGFDIPTVESPPLPDVVRNAIGPRADAEFTVIFVDDTLRITEGDRGELRIFVRDAMSVLI